jgi:hypothetical protein
MAEAKTIVFRYDDLDATEEEVTDLTGSVEVPRVGDIIFRKNQLWKVMGVYPGHADAIPRFRVLLMDASKPQFVN